MSLTESQDRLGGEVFYNSSPTTGQKNLTILWQIKYEDSLGRDNEKKKQKKIHFDLIT